MPPSARTKNRLRYVPMLRRLTTNLSDLPRKTGQLTYQTMKVDVIWILVAAHSNRNQRATEKGWTTGFINRLYGQGESLIG